MPKRIKRSTSRPAKDLATSETQAAGRNARPPQPLDPATTAQAVLDLADLANRVLTVGQRGRTPLAIKDEKVLRDVKAKLERHRYAYAGDSVGKKTSTLTPEQAALGRLRIEFDVRCEQASRHQPDDKRDHILAEVLEEACRKQGFLIGREIIDQALQAVRKGAADRAKDEDLTDLPEDWLKRTRSSDARNSAVIAAGEILRETMVRHRPGIAASGSSTAEYARRAVTQAPSASVRRVRPGERLTFLMTALGVPLHTAPSVAFLVCMLINGISPGAAPLTGDEWESLHRWAVGAAAHVPVPFRLLRREDQDQLDAAAQQLIPERLRQQLHNLLPLFQPWQDPSAGTEIAPGSWERSREMERHWPDPWGQ